MRECVTLIVAAGSGVRLGTGLPKQYRALGGVPILRRTIEAFARAPGVDRVAVVINPAHDDLFRMATDGLDLMPPIAGGPTRQDSVRLGLEALDGERPRRVLIQDAARPFVSSDVIARVCNALEHCPGAIAAVPVTDTIKRADEDGLIGGTVARAGLWNAQTPQGFDFPRILAAHRSAAGEDLTDDAAVAEQAGLPAAIVAGDPDNFKITTEHDLQRAQAMLDRSEPAADSGIIRAGQGFDVHRFEAGDGVRLCGITVPHSRRLAGHSDADVALHALTDALLGAVGAGDIGHHFPPSDAQWQGVDSAVFLRHALQLVRSRNANVLAVDVTIICEEPKVKPYRSAMVDRLSELLDLSPERISVKATTTEGLGFTGRREGIAAQALATVRVAD